MSAVDVIVRVLDVADDVFTVASAIVRAAKARDWKRVEELLPEELATTLAQKAADIRAEEKFGAPGGG